MGGGVSTDFKSSNRIEISRLVQVLLNFEWFRGSPLGGRGWVDGIGGSWDSAPHPTAHACTHMHAHAHACTYNIIGNPRDFPKSNGGGHLHEITMFTMHACACMHMHVHVCGGHPPTTPTPIHSPTTPHPPTPKSRRKPKTPKFDNSWTNQDNLILFEDSLPLNIPELI